MYQPAVAFTKNSILLQLLEMFVPGRAGWRYWTLVGLIIFNFVFFTIIMFLEIFECSPRRKIWDSSVPGHCINIEQTFIATASINVAEDFAILVLPIIWVWQIQIAMKKKFKVTAVFAAALL